VAAELIQILSTCPHCKVEAAVVELVELARGESTVVEGRCRMCGRRTDATGEVQPGQRFSTRLQVHGALARWAAEEGEPDVASFVASGFGGLSEDEVVDALLAGRPLQTGFDVIAWLFPGMAGGGGAAPDPARAVQRGPREGGGVLARSPLPAGTDVALAPAAAAPVDPRRVAVQGLLAVMLSDGLVRPGERRFLDAFVARLGLAPLVDADIRPWRPNEVPRPDDPEPILRAMVELCFIDRERDGSEWRVVREFARAWAFPLAELEALGRDREEAVAPAMTRLWRALVRLFVVGGA